MIFLSWYTQKGGKLTSQLVSQNRDPEITMNLLSQSLLDPEAKFRFMESVAQNKLKPLLPIVKRLEANLPEDDANKRRIAAIWVDAGYPFEGPPAHLLGDKEVTYQPVSYEKLKKLFGEKVAKKLGKSWTRAWTDPEKQKKEPSHAILGDTLKDENGKDLKLSWNQAMAECLALNAEWDLTIPAELKRIQEMPSQEGKDWWNMSSSEKQECLKKYQAYEELDKKVRDGIKTYQKACYVPEEAILYVLSQDLKKSAKYMPQYLPNLYRWSTWSGSGHPHDPVNAFFFYGGVGGVVYGYRGYEEAVRCSCSSVAAW